MRTVIPVVALVLANPLLDRAAPSTPCGPVSVQPAKGASR